jgi:hypothetical protein
MNRRLLILPATAALAGAIALAACSSTPPAASGAAPPVALPSIAIPSITLPSIALPSLPSFTTNADPELAAKFPKTIDGQPVTVSTFRFAEFMATLPSASVDQFKAFATQAGIDVNAITFGLAQASVGGSTVSIQAIRSPGGDANRFIQAIVAVAQAGGSPIALSPATVGGKNVQVANPGDSAEYYYPAGDTAFLVTNVDATTAATILTALP